MQAGSTDTFEHSGFPSHTSNKHQACSPVLDEVGPAVPGAVVIAPVESVHGTRWKVPGRSAEAI